MTHTEPPDLRKVSIRFPDGRETTFQATTITVGTSPACDVSLPDAKHLAPQHARFRRMGDRWSIECTGGEELFVGNAPPGRMHWITPGDQIRLSSTGPLLVFHPKVEDKPRIATLAANPTSPPNLTSQSGYALAQPVAGRHEDSPFAGDDVHLTGIRLPTRTKSGPGLFAMLSPGIAALGIVGLVMWLGRSQPVDPKVTVQTPAETETAGTATPPLPPAVQPGPEIPIGARGVYWIGVEMKGSPFPLGTCWAYRPDRIVMPATSVLSLRDDETLRVHSTDGQIRPIRVVEIRQHPRFAATKDDIEKRQFNIVVGHLESPLPHFEQMVGLADLRQIRKGSLVRWVGHDFPTIDPVAFPGVDPKTYRPFDSTVDLQHFVRQLTVLSSDTNLGYEPLFKCVEELAPTAVGPIFDRSGRVLGTMIGKGIILPVDRLNDFDPTNLVVK